MQPEELVEHEPPPGRLDHGERLGDVDGPERLGPLPHCERRPPLGRQRVGELARPGERLLHELPDLPRGQPRLGRGGVHGQDPQGPPAGGHPRHDVDYRIDHLAGTPVLADLAEEDRLGARLELLGPPWLVEEDDGQPARVVAHRQLDHGAPVPGPPRPRRMHRRQDRSLVAHVESRDVGLAGAVDVAPGVRRHQVEDRFDAELGQAGRLALRHRLEHRHGPGAAGRGGCGRYSIPSRYG